jgi:dimethylargininase
VNGARQTVASRNPFPSGSGLSRAIVRPPGASFAQALSGQQPRPVIDVALARRQHAGYCAALRSCGLELIELPPDEDHPDACFVQDTAVVYGDLALIARFGVESRQGEQDAVRRALQPHKRLIQLESPATLEGGDVLIVGSRLFVGLSARTNRAGFARLRDLLELEGASVETLPVPSGLHLLSGCTYLGRGVLLVTDDYAGLPAFAGLDLILVPPDEAPAANALAVGENVLLADGYPRTADLVRRQGFQVLPLSLTEFAKADGGVTCLSLPF